PQDRQNTHLHRPMQSVDAVPARDAGDGRAAPEVAALDTETVRRCVSGILSPPKGAKRKGWISAIPRQGPMGCVWLLRVHRHPVRWQAAALRWLAWWPQSAFSTANDKWGGHRRWKGR